MSQENTSSSYLKAYVQFLELSLNAQTTGIDSVAELDPNEKALLEMVMMRWFARQPLTVRQAIAMAELGSPATLHKRLIRLRSKAYLTLQSVATDKRMRHLVPTEKGTKYFENQGRLLYKARR